MDNLAYKSGGNIELVDERDFTNSITGGMYSIGRIKGLKGDYGIGVYLDRKYFGKSNSRTWTPKVRNFIKNNLVNKYFTIYDDAGNAENIYFAKEKERITKDGSKNSRKVIDELAFRNDPIESKSIFILKNVPVKKPSITLYSLPQSNGIYNVQNTENGDVNTVEGEQPDKVRSYPNA